MKRTGYKDKEGKHILIGDQVWLDGELYEVVKNVVPFNHYALYNPNRSIRLEEVHARCKRKEPVKSD